MFRYTDTISLVIQCPMLSRQNKINYMHAHKLSKEQSACHFIYQSPLGDSHTSNILSVNRSAT